ncbi:MAG: ABC transporter permease [Bacteroidota bacterium]
MSASIVFNDFWRSTRAESYKLKRTPIFWIAVLIGLLGGSIVFSLYLFLPDEFVSMDTTSPWRSYYKMSYHVMSLLFMVPYIVLISSTVVNTEHQSNAWKYLYSLPLRRGTIYFSKLFIVIALIAFSFLLFSLTVWLGGLILSVAQPVYEFQQYATEFGHWMGIVGHAFLSVLGLIAIQYWFCVRWKNYIIPIGLGMMGYVFSIIASGKDTYDLLLPHSYCMNVSKKLSNNAVFAEDYLYGPLLHVEWISIALFIVFCLVGYYEQKLSNVK